MECKAIDLTREVQRVNRERDTYHLVGIAGVGMSALAQVVLAAGWRVTGSDRYLDQGRDLEVLTKLRQGGVVLVSQDGGALGSHTRAVVVSTAIEKDNPEMLAARKLAIPIWHRADMLAALLRGQECLAIAGTSGKTTVTGMVGWMLEQLGADPTVVNGGVVLNWVGEKRLGNVRIGQSKLWVIEADESDRSFLRYDPDWAIITNLAADHFDLAETQRLFAEFRQKVKRGVVEGETIHGSADFKPLLTAQAASFVYGGVDFHVPLPGRHNAENALQAIMLCEKMGYALPRIGAALAGFKGIQRRMEQVGVGAIPVFDDYAHNPAKIAAAWQTLAPYQRRVLGVWRPHGFAPLAQMLGGLTVAFGEICRPQDRLFILPVYYAGGTAKRDVTAATLVENLRARGIAVELIADYQEAEANLLALAQAGDAVLCMGARDPELPVFARRLAQRLAAGGTSRRED